jgi:hypothetical protein
MMRLGVSVCKKMTVHGSQMVSALSPLARRQVTQVLYRQRLNPVMSHEGDTVKREMHCHSKWPCRTSRKRGLR